MEVGLCPRLTVICTHVSHIYIYTHIHIHIHIGTPQTCYTNTHRLHIPTIHTYYTHNASFAYIRTYRTSTHPLTYYTHISLASCTQQKYTHTYSIQIYHTYIETCHIHICLHIHTYTLHTKQTHMNIHITCINITHAYNPDNIYTHTKRSHMHFINM